MYSCSNCKWEGEELSKRPQDPLDNKCPKCGDEVILIEKEVVEKKSVFDLDKDGDVDKDDVKLALKKIIPRRRKRK